MPTKKVRIKRNRPFIHEAMNSEAVQASLSQTRRGLGSYWATRDSKVSGSGLTPVEEKILLPLVIGVPSSSEKFIEARNTFYDEINTVVPHGSLGRELEIGFTLDNNQPLSINHEDPEKSNIPINVGHYLAFRHAIGKRNQDGISATGFKGHPHVAFSPETALGDSTIQYYLEDPEKVELAKMSILQKQEKAMACYIQLINEGVEGEEKIKMIVTLMRGLLRAKPGEPKTDPNTASKNELRLIFKTLSEEHPERFVEYANDKFLVARYKISQYISSGIMVRYQGVIVDAETKDKLGDDILQVVNKLSDPKNVELKNKYKIAYENKRNQPISFDTDYQ